MPTDEEFNRMCRADLLADIAAMKSASQHIQDAEEYDRVQSEIRLADATYNVLDMAAWLRINAPREETAPSVASMCAYQLERARRNCDGE